MEFLRNITEGIDNSSVLEDGENSSEFAGTVDSGSYILNAALSGSIYGGVPSSKITMFAGASATGKTYFALGIVQKFIKDNPDGGVIYFDSESAVTKKMMEDRGINPKQVVISEPVTMEEFRTTATKILDNYMKTSKRPPMMMVLDSLGMLSTNKEIGDVSDGNDKVDFTKAKLVRGAFRVLSLKLAKANCPLIVTNHTYDKMDSMYPTQEISGGQGSRYAASTICLLSKRKDKEGVDIVGNIIRIKMDKSRFTKENRQVEVKLSYETGLDRWYGLVDLAVKYDIFKKVSTRIELPDGTKLFEKQLYRDGQKYIGPYLDKIEEAAHIEFEYGQHDSIEPADEDDSSTEE